MSNDEKLIFEANGASPLEIARLNKIAHEAIREKAIKQQARAEVIEQIREALGEYDIDQMYAFLDKLSEGK